MTPQFSLVYLTYRPGGIDLLGVSLAHQYPLYELIVVDDCPGRFERGKAKDYLLSLGLPLRYYGPSKAHSYPDKKVHGLANAKNTAVLACSTDYLVFTADYTWFPSGQMVQWYCLKNSVPRNTLVSSVASRKHARLPEIHGADADISIWSNPGPAGNVFHEAEEWVPKVFETFTWGCPLEFIERINGFDERADTVGISSLLSCIVTQAPRHGFNVTVDRRLRVELADHREWGEAQGMDLWRTDHVRGPTEQPKWEKASPNPFNLTELMGRSVIPKEDK